MTQPLIDDQLLSRCQADADRDYGGDVRTMIAAGLNFYLSMQDANHAVLDMAPPQPGETEEDRLLRVVNAAGVSRSTLLGMAGTLQRVAGGPVGDLAAAPTYVKSYVDYVRADPVGRAVGCTLVSTQGGAGDAGAQRGAPVGFATGFLYGQNTGTTITGSLAEYFSDRTANGAPFNPAQQDQIRVDITLDEFMGNATVEVISETWGDARQTLGDLRIEEGVLVASGANVGNQGPTAHYALSLYTTTIPG